MAAKSNMQIMKTPSYRLSLDGGRRETMARRLGLGAGSNTTDQLVKETLSEVLNPSYPVHLIHNLEHTTWDFDGPITNQEITEIFGNSVDIFNSGKIVPGVDAVQSTFIHPGILQTGIIVTHLGFHIFAEPLCFTALGNVLAPVPVAPEAAPASNDAMTDKFLASALAAGESLTPAFLSWGWPMQYAAWHFIHAYNFDWIVRQRYHILSESARYIAHFASFSDEVGAGNSTVPVQPFAARANKRLLQEGGTGIFLPATRHRQGVFTDGTAGEVDVARADRSNELVPVLWGGLQLQNRYTNCMWRKLHLPHFIPQNSPIGLQLNVSDEVQQQHFYEQMSISDFQTTGSIPPVVGPFDPNIQQGLDLGYPELSLDATPAPVVAKIPVGRVDVKGGTIEFSMIVKGFEVTDEFAKRMNEQHMRGHLSGSLGLQFCC